MVERLRSGHERLATQMAENLKVIATARAVTEDLLTDVATAIGAERARQDLRRRRPDRQQPRSRGTRHRHQPGALTDGQFDLNCRRGGNPGAGIRRIVCDRSFRSKDGRRI